MAVTERRWSEELDGPFPASHTPSLKGDDNTNGDCRRTGTMMPSSADSSFGVPLEREGSATSNENRWRRADIRRSAGTVTYINAITRRPISSFPGLLFEAVSDDSAICEDSSTGWSSSDSDEPW